MKKEIILIPAFLLVVALAISVKVVRAYTVAHSQIIHENLLACDPSDPPIGSPGE